MPKQYDNKTRKEDGISFEDWKKECETECKRRVGMGTNLFPDIDFWSNWDSGQNAKECIQDLLVENGYGSF